MKSRSILIVDDDPDIRGLMKEMLSLKGHSIVVAQNGSEATFKLKNQKFDLIITDLQMPKKSGDQFIREVRGNNAEVPILVVSGNLNSFNMNSTMEPNLSILEKPFSTNQLVEKVEGIFEPRKTVENENQKSRRKLEVNEVIIQEGEDAHEMYWIIEGTFLIYKDDNGKEVTLGHAHPGELLGEMSFVDCQKRSAHVRALTKAEVLVIPNGKFAKILENQPPWFKSLVKTLSLRLRETNKKVK